MYSDAIKEFWQQFLNEIVKLSMWSGYYELWEVYVMEMKVDTVQPV